MHVIRRDLSDGWDQSRMIMRTAEVKFNRFHHNFKSKRFSSCASYRTINPRQARRPPKDNIHIGPATLQTPGEENRNSCMRFRSAASLMQVAGHQSVRVWTLCCCSRSRDRDSNAASIIKRSRLGGSNMRGDGT